MKLRLGTRGSDLALTQSRWVASELARSGVDCELVTISTSGDRSSAPSFGAIGPQGVFVREIEQALIDGRIDLAVHSFKDLPTHSPDALVIAAVPTRRDCADWLLTRTSGQQKRGQSPFSAGASPTTDGDSDSDSDKRAPTPFSASFSGLAQGARIGTSSARRQAWVRHFRSDLAIEPLRGNVPTRLRRLADGDYDAILLAAAGIERLAEATQVLDDVLAAVDRQRLDPVVFIPAPAQGALALQCRADDTAVRAALAAIDDASARTCVDLERSALALAEGGCDTAFGAHAVKSDRGFTLHVMIERAGAVVSAQASGPDVAALPAAAMGALDAATRSTA